MDFLRGNWFFRDLASAGLVLGIVLPAGAGEVSQDVQASAFIAPSCSVAPKTAMRFKIVAHRRELAYRRATPRQQALAERPSEPQPSFSQAYFTCSTKPLTALPVGAGWLAVGPVRRS